MKLKSLIIILMLFGYQVFSQKKLTQSERLKWWQDSKMGLFVHWGPVSLIGKEISWSRAGYGAAKYDSLYLRFNPEKFDAKEWVSLAKASGMKYIVLTAKHHDGFCLFETKTTPYNIMNTPFGRDVCKELAEAAHEANMPICWYFSVADWKDPDCRDPKTNGIFADSVFEQVKELLTNYGKIGLLWIDYEGDPSPIQPKRIFDLARKLQPEIIINNRLEPFSPDESHSYIGQYADYATPEGFVAGYSAVPWETCTNMGHQWAWKFNDTPRSLRESLHTLLRCVGGNGNLLFNIGPDSSGIFPPNFAQRAREMGSWIDKNTKAIHNTKGGVYSPAEKYVSANRGNDLFLFSLDNQSSELILPSLPAKIEKAYMLDGTELTFSQTKNQVKINFPKDKIDSVATIAVLQLDKNVASLKPIIPTTTSNSLGYGKTASASSSVGQFYHDPAAAFDDNPNTNWKLGRRTDVDFNQYYGKKMHYMSEEGMALYQPTGWLQIKLEEPKNVGQIKLTEAIKSGSQIQKFEVQYEQKGEWITMAKGDRMVNWQQEVVPVTAQNFRLVIEKYHGYFGVAEFELFPPKK